MRASLSYSCFFSARYGACDLFLGLGFSGVFLEVAANNEMVALQEREYYIEQMELY